MAAHELGGICVFGSPLGYFVVWRRSLCLHLSGPTGYAWVAVDGPHVVVCMWVLDRPPLLFGAISVRGSRTSLGVANI